MTLLAANGFDTYDNITELVALDSRFSLITAAGGSSTLPTTGGRFGGGHLLINSGNNGETSTKLDITPLQPATVFFGISFFSPVVSSASDFLVFKEGTNTHVRLRQIATGTTVEVYILGVLQVTTFELSKTQWHRIEVQLTVNNTTGVLTINLDGTQVFTVSGIDTQQGSNAWTDVFSMQSNVPTSAPTVLFDDLTLNDDQGGINDGFLGDVRIQTLRPTSAGFVTNFTPSAGANWENVDETTGPDDDTTFNETSIATDQDLYNISNLTGTVASIKAVVIRATARKDDAGSRTIELLSRTGGSTDVGATQTLLTTYSNFEEIHEVDPDTAVAWTPAGVDASQIGLENN